MMLDVVNEGGNEELEWSICSHLSFCRGEKWARMKMTAKNRPRAAWLKMALFGFDGLGNSRLGFGSASNHGGRAPEDSDQSED